MKRISATLPTLGTIAVDFHDESMEVLEYLTDKELRRLRDVPHLGVAGSVFTGVNHSRLEYVLLQCAVIGLVAKLHKDHEVFALGNKVKINGLAKPFSSGQELLKSWALLGNSGHTQYTYGIERSLLQQARVSRPLADWFLKDLRPADLRAWAKRVLDDYDDGQMHFVLALVRIREQLPTRDRRKARYFHVLRNLLLPPEELFPNDPSAQYKLVRLRFLYSRIRLLTMVTLDSYYSHHPFRIQLDAAIHSLADMVSVSEQDSGFERLVTQSATWLADELYLHPSAVAAQREYELRLARSLPGRVARALARTNGPRAFLNQCLFSGFGRPKPHRFTHLVRLTFDSPGLSFTGDKCLHDTLNTLERELAAPPVTHVSVDRNRFSSAIHVDLLMDRDTGTTVHAAAAFRSAGVWLGRRLELAALEEVRRVLPASVRANNQVVERLRQRSLQNRLQREATVVRSLFDGIVRRLLPENRVADVAEMLGKHEKRSGVLVRYRDSQGHVFDGITPVLDDHLSNNPRRYDADRLQEVRALQRLVARNSAPFVIVCAEKYVVRDQAGKPVDEWDGIVVSFTANALTVEILEAKNFGSRKKNENEAFKQLKETRQLLTTRERIRFRTRRFAGMGAVLTLGLQG